MRACEEVLQLLCMSCAGLMSSCARGSDANDVSSFLYLLVNVIVFEGH